MHSTACLHLLTTHEKTGATNSLHPAVAMSVSLKPGLFLWSWSLIAHDLQDTVEIWALHVYSESGTLGLKSPECLDNSALNMQRCQQAASHCWTPGKWPVLPRQVLMQQFWTSALHVQHLDAVSVPCHPSCQPARPTLNKEQMHGCHCPAGPPPLWEPWRWKKGPGTFARDAAEFSVTPLPFNHYCSAKQFHVLVKTRSALHFHLTHFDFISAFWFDRISLNALCLAVPAIPFITPHTGSILTAASLVAPHDCYFLVVMKVVSLPLSATVVYSPQWCVHEKTNRLSF